MDHPLGARVPDKRNEAYESIFGRPVAAHHPQQLYSQSNGQAYLYPAHQPYQTSLDRRLTYQPPQMYPVQPPPPGCGPPYYRSPSPQPPPIPPRDYHAYAPSPYPQPQSLAPPSVHSRSASASSGNYIIDSLPPHSDDPLETDFDALARSGLTPAQAYQAQVYLTSTSVPSGSQHRNNNSTGSTPDYILPSHVPTGKPPEPPRIGVTLDHDDGGQLAIDFNPAIGGNISDRGSDDGSSELQWAQRQHMPGIRSSFPRNPDPQMLRAPHQMAAGPRRTPDQPVTAYDPAGSSSSRPYPLHVDTRALPPPSSVVDTSPSSTLLDRTASNASASTRQSSESSRTMPIRGPIGLRRERSIQDRSLSMSAVTPAGGRPPRPPIPPNFEDKRSSNSTRPPVPRRSPIVYPALLSRVAEAFRDRISLSDRIKDALTYKDAFDGREAVDKIAYIIKTTDRNLALLLGRALDAQKFFHDVTYDHRLRDSPNELYQFRTKLPSPFVSGEELANEDDVEGIVLPQNEMPEFDQADKDDVSPSTTRPRRGSIMSDEVPLPSGVFTLLTDCYSPTCSRDHLCYSIACPRRMEQQARLNMKPQPGLTKQISRESLGDAVEPGTLWIHSVPPEIVNSVSDDEKKRQEAINEVIYTERDFVRDMEYLRDTWINRLQAQEIIPHPRRSDFLEQVFWNIHDIIAVNTRLRDALNKRQKSYAVVEKIGDILLDAVPHFGPFVSYGAHQLYGKYEFEKEKSSNPAFASFVEATERLPESRKLELNAYLTKPTTRLARYPLLLGAVLKHTPEDNPDKTLLPQVIVLVREFLAKVNEETGKTENRFNLLELDQQLMFKPGEKVDLRLKDEGRELIYKGALNKRSGGVQGADSGDLQVYLFDHALLMVKQQKSKHEQSKVYKRPIPLELLLISASDDVGAVARGQPNRTKSIISKRNSLNGNNRAPLIPNVPLVPLTNKGQQQQHSITFVHLGRNYYHMTLWAGTAYNQRKWVEHILKQQDAMRERSMIFDTVTLCEGFFAGSNKVNCAAPFRWGKSIVYGTDDGVYVSDLQNTNAEPVKVLSMSDVSQIDVLEYHQLLVVLSERQVITFPLEALDPQDPMAGLKRAKRISSHTAFFKVGVCLGRVLVCIVKCSPLSSTIKTLEPIDQNIRGRSKPTFRKLLQGGNDTLKPFREFYIPVESSSIHFLKTKLCVGCVKGFEIVDLETLDTQPLLDPADESLEFVIKKDNLRPMAIYRVDNEFLLCYDDFAFYVNKNGWRSRKEFMVHWEGSPTGFALHYPYVLAFEPTFVEIRHVETGHMSQVIQGNNLRLLFADTPPSTTNTATSSQFNPHHIGYGHNQQYPMPCPTGSQQGQNMHGPGNPGIVPGAGHGHGQGYPHGQMPGYGPPVSQFGRGPLGGGRDEIILVSDDRVLSLKLTGSGQTSFSDSASMVSMTR